MTVTPAATMTMSPQSRLKCTRPNLSCKIVPTMEKYRPLLPNITSVVMINTDLWFPYWVKTASIIPWRMAPTMTYIVRGTQRSVRSEMKPIVNVTNMPTNILPVSNTSSRFPIFTLAPMIETLSIYITPTLTDKKNPHASKWKSSSQSLSNPILSTQPPWRWFWVQPLDSSTTSASNVDTKAFFSTSSSIGRGLTKTAANDLKTKLESATRRKMYPTLCGLPVGSRQT